MPKNSATSISAIFVISLVCAGFVAFIAWGSFSDPIRIFIAAAITFIVVLVSLILLRVFQKDDDVKPGVPRLK
ncbi:MAG: hypothetical protein EBR26_00260 [Microbacteriaceae bacterium]|nr:hypothetical protein [Microbacteriaceae bacterium]